MASRLRNHWARKVDVSVEVGRDTVVLSEPKEVRYLARADQITRIDVRAHAPESTKVDHFALGYRHISRSARSQLAWASS